MVSVTIRHFDSLEYLETSKKLGVSQAVAIYQTKQIEKTIDIAVNNVREEVKSRELPTKIDVKELELKIDQVKTQFILWVVGIMAIFTVLFLGVLAKGFHWI